MLKPIRRQTHLILKKRIEKLIQNQYQAEFFSQKCHGKNHNNNVKEQYKFNISNKEKILYILLVASELQQKTNKIFISKYFPKSILKSLVANNINKSLIGSGITFLVSDFASTPAQITKLYAGKTIISSFLYHNLESNIKNEIINNNIFELCLGALVLKPQSDHVTYIEPSELSSYGKGPNTYDVYQKLQCQLQQCHLTSALPLVKLLTIFKQKMLKVQKKKVTKTLLV